MNLSYGLIEFKAYDPTSRKILDNILDNRHVFFKESPDGSVEVLFDPPHLVPLLFTGFVIAGGDGSEKIYDGDIVEVLVQTDRGRERMTDAVYWMDGAWRFGAFGSVLGEHVLMAKRGNRLTTPWPEPMAPCEG